MMYEGRLEGREWRPRDVRVDSACNVTVQCAAGDVPGRIVNISSEGFRLHAQAALQPGWEVTLLAARHDPIKAVICWASGQEAGGIFSEAVAL